MKLEQIDTSTAGKAEVMRLAAEGRRVAELIQLHQGGAEWLATLSTDWDWRSCKYAIIAEPVLDRPARVGGRDFPAGSLIQQVIGRAHAEYDRHHHSRDPRDVASDPEGILLCAAGEPLMAAQKRAPVGPDELWVAVSSGGFPATTSGARVHADHWVEQRGGTVVRYVRAD